MIGLLLAATLTFGEVTPNRGGIDCTDSSVVIPAGKPYVAHTRVLLAGKRIWEDSVATKVGDAWTIPQPVEPFSTYALNYWYSGPHAPATCAHTQPWVFQPAYVVDMTWATQGAIFRSATGQMVNIVDIAKVLNAYGDTVSVLRAQLAKAWPVKAGK